MEFSPGDGRLVATGTFDGSLRLFDASSGEPLDRCRRHASAINDLSFATDGTRLATASSDKTVNVLQV